jgi:hypothetical protein
MAIASPPAIAFCIDSSMIIKLLPKILLTSLADLD